MPSAAAITRNSPASQLDRSATNQVERRRSLLVAFDGGVASQAALRVAADIARTRGSALEVLVVEPPVLAGLPSSETGIPTAGDWVAEQPHRRRLELRGKIDQLMERRTQWPIDLEIGWPAEVIVREAERREPFLIALGLRPHRVLERVLYGGTTLPVVRHASVPVLAATPALTATPRRIVVAVDFSRASLRAARVALKMLGNGGTLLLTHVTPELDFSAGSAEGRGVEYSQGIVAAFARLIQELDAPPNVSVETAFLEGPVAPALLAYSSAAQADLIAVGSQRHRFMERLMVGSVTEALVRSARRSLLISPPPALSSSR